MVPKSRVLPWQKPKTYSISFGLKGSKETVEIGKEGIAGWEPMLGIIKTPGETVISNDMENKNWAWWSCRSGCIYFQAEFCNLIWPHLTAYACILQEKNDIKKEYFSSQGH